MSQIDTETKRKLREMGAGTQALLLIIGLALLIAFAFSTAASIPARFFPPAVAKPGFPPPPP